SNYQQVINLAADEGGGQGFVTEMASAASPLSEVIFSAGEDSYWQSLRAADWSNQPAQLLAQIIDTYSTFDPNTFSMIAWDGVPEVVRAHVPLPDGVTVQDVLSCARCYFNSADPIVGFDSAAFLAAMED